MKNAFIAAALTAAALVSCGPKYTEPVSIPGSEIAYSMSFIRNVAANVDKNENVVVSPYSAGVALSMLAEGAEGETREEFDDMLNVLPPLKWIRNERYSMFCVGECTTMTYYAQYIRIHGTGKCYCALTDIYDRTTWIDKLLGLRK